MLMLNQDQTELITSKVSDENQLRVGEETVHVARSVENFGVCFDRSLTMKRQVNAIPSAC